MIDARSGVCWEIAKSVAVGGGEAAWLIECCWRRELRDEREVGPEEKVAAVTKALERNARWWAVLHAASGSIVFEDGRKRSKFADDGARQRPDRHNLHLHFFLDSSLDQIFPPPAFFRVVHHRTNPDERKHIPAKLLCPLISSLALLLRRSRRARRLDRRLLLEPVQVDWHTPQPRPSHSQELVHVPTLPKLLSIDRRRGRFE